ncbi:MAG: alanine racemase [Phycisphaerae bacterium]|nr:alanine racemase [Phycisphaerae bacterium]
MEPVVAHVSRAALIGNLSAIRRRAGDAAICAMVKADAYGHGLAGVATTLAAAGAEMFGVARVEEAEAVRRLGLDQPILLCEPLVDPAGDSYLSDRLEAICRVPGIRPTIADEFAVAPAGRLARRLGVRLAVHLKVDSGMGRSGCQLERADAIVRAIDAQPALELEGVYTHLATADEADEAFARGQLARFEQFVAEFAAAGRRFRYVHATNSAGLARFGSPMMTLVRPGIAIYGYLPDAAASPPDWAIPVAPVLRMTARLMLVKDIPAGAPVGYGCTWRAKRASRIGLAPVGYGDGYLRRFGNRAVMQVAGRDVPVVGRVSMDLTTLDLTDLPGGVRAGAEVTVISERRGDANSVEALARLADTIPYEITCLIGSRVRREIVDSFPERA